MSTGGQRRALAATIPTTEVIKDAVTFPRDRLGEPLDISPERFDAWLRSVRRDAAREALDGLARLAVQIEDGHGRLVPAKRVRDDWAMVERAARNYRDTHYGNAE